MTGAGQVPLTQQLTVELTIRELTLDDLPDVAWSGGTEHLAHVAEQLAAAEDGRRRVLAVQLPNGLLVAKGGVAFDSPAAYAGPDTGVLWMFAVRESWQSLGVGTALVTALERAVVESGRTRTALTVEHDNPRAAALYRRLGYTAEGHVLEGWPVGPRTSYVTVCTVMTRTLHGSSAAESDQPARSRH